MEERTEGSIEQKKTEDSHAGKETGRDGKKKVLGKTGLPTIIASGAIIVVVFFLAGFGWLPVLGDARYQWIPFVFVLVGVVFYVMSSAKTRRDRFKIEYLPDYVFRGAQAVVYLYIIISVMAQADDEAISYLTRWSPNLIGLLVGMFIPHVEKAMEGLGQRFEEVLAGILPRALTAKTSREKQLEQLRAENKFNEIKIQSEGLASQIRDAGMSAVLKKRLDTLAQTIREHDMDGIQDQVSELTWQFEEIKRSLREEELTVQEILKADRGK